MKRVTVLDAVVLVLRDAGAAGLSPNEIYEQIVARSLFAFKAQDPLAIVRAAIRKHLRTHGGAGLPPARLKRLAGDRYAMPESQ